MFPASRTFSPIPCHVCTSLAPPVLCGEPLITLNMIRCGQTNLVLLMCRLLRSTRPRRSTRLASRSVASSDESTRLIRSYSQTSEGLTFLCLLLCPRFQRRGRPTKIAPPLVDVAGPPAVLPPQSDKPGRGRRPRAEPLTCGDESSLRLFPSLPSVW